jgi:hypothetical protein
LPNLTRRREPAELHRAWRARAARLAAGSRGDPEPVRRLLAGGGDHLVPGAESDIEATADVTIAATMTADGKATARTTRSYRFELSDLAGWKVCDVIPTD